ncbi:MAG TPA: hypothetical protein VN961_11640 [Streptosporangiaceae bacterium]|nr:hypothetical protein [Streptosporangiaceae bacterium]
MAITERYSKFGLGPDRTEPAKLQPGYTSFAIAEPLLKLVLLGA